MEAGIEHAVSDTILADSGCPPRKKGEMNFGDEVAVKVLLSTFIVFDILACASTRSTPSLELDHKVVLNALAMDLERLFGYATWLLVLLLEVVLLDNWKKEAEKDRKLSMVELVQRGAKIESLLQQKLRDLDATFPLGSHQLENSGTTSTDFTATQTEITRIFALSVLTYLHVVVSGPYPNLPEITESVSKTIIAFERLSDVKVIRYLVWPFCVSGCLALEGQQNFFRDLASRVKIINSTLRTFPEAYKIIEECYETRKACSYCDWASVVNEQGYDILLM